MIALARVLLSTHPDLKFQHLAPQIAPRLGLTAAEVEHILRTRTSALAHGQQRKLRDQKAAQNAAFREHRRQQRYQLEEVFGEFCVLDTSLPGDPEAQRVVVCRHFAADKIAEYLNDGLDLLTAVVRSHSEKRRARDWKYGVEDEDPPGWFVYDGTREHANRNPLDPEALDLYDPRRTLGGRCWGPFRDYDLADQFRESHEFLRTWCIVQGYAEGDLFPPATFHGRWPT